MINILKPVFLFTSFVLVSGATAGLIETYQAAQTVKVVFSKKHFYNNSEPLNSIGCAGDAKSFFDPQTDRIVPSKPKWLRNISVDITNANAPFGSSRSLFCSYGASYASLPAACTGPNPASYCNVPPPPSNCAAFDDMQALTGLETKAYLIGGVNYEDGTENRSRTIWTVTINDTNGTSTPSTAVKFSRLSSQLPISTRSDSTVHSSALLYSGWAFDEIHNWLIGYGGVDNTSSTPVISDSLLRLYQGPVSQSTRDPSTIGIETLDINTGTPTQKLNTRAGLAGMRSATAPAGNINPIYKLGHSFTYISRRHPSLQRRYLDNSATCSSDTSYNYCYLYSQPTAATQFSSEYAWEDSDYFLSIGGIEAESQPARNLSSTVAALMPHRITTKTGDADNPNASDLMSWEWLNHGESFSSARDNALSRTIDLSTNGAIPTSWDHVDRFGRAGGNSYFPGRAYHRAVYDSKMNRVYIFGGLITASSAGVVSNITSTSAFTIEGRLTTTTATLSPTAETWIYDLPSLGRTPTLGCQTSTNFNYDGRLPGIQSTHLAQTAAIENTKYSTVSPTDLNLIQNSTVFPPGGCMQYAQPVTDTIATASTADDGGTAQNYEQPPQRLEHAMAFDEDQGVVIMFGGCINAPPLDGTTNWLQGTNTAIPYDPTRNCGDRTAFLNDTWMYVPPQSLESALVTAVNGTTTAYTFGRPDFIAPLDPLWHGAPLIYNNGLTTLSTPEVQARTNGAWIKLNGDDAQTIQGAGTYPYARASASFWYDKSHHKFYLFGGKKFDGTYLNDLWEYTPPLASSCKSSYSASPSEIACASPGVWRMIYDKVDDYYNTSDTTVSYPAPVMAAAGVYATRAPDDYAHSGDNYYTVSDNACDGQGLVIGSSATSKEAVGGVYIDIDRSQFASTENLLINIKLFPFSKNTYTSTGVDNKDGTKLPGYHFNGTYGLTTMDDRDTATDTDNALIRVLLMVNPISLTDALFTQIQPRFRTYQPPGTVVISQDYDLGANGTGLPTEKQIFVPLSMDPRINMIKIERVRGTVKFFDMSVTKI